MIDRIKSKFREAAEKYTPIGTAEYLFLLFLFLKQFYILPSGSLGMGDYCLAGCFLTMILSDYPKRKQPQVWKEDRLLLAFLFCVLVINGVYAGYTRDGGYLKYTVFWWFNGAAIWSMRRLAAADGHECDGVPFLRHVNLVVKGNVIVQFVICLSGQGRIFQEYWGATRYMGTFNDPNQLAFFLFMMLLLLFLYRCRFGDRTFGIFYVLSVWVILESKSTGILLGTAAFTFGVGVWGLWNLYWSKRMPRWMWAAAGVCAVSLAVIVTIVIWPAPDFDVQKVDYNMLTRIQEKIWKAVHGGLGGMLLDRGAEKLMLYPRYLIFGAGEGGFERFTLVRLVSEIHSSFLSIWFCYGMIPMTVLMVWLVRRLKAVRGQMWIAVTALLLESFLLVNYRQPLFWMILLYGELSEKK